MNPKTLLVDFAPTITKETPSQLKRRAYAEEVLALYDLGDVTVCTMQECRELLTHTDPDIIIATSDHEASELKTLKPEAVLYSAISANSVFSRKAEEEERKEENKKIFDDAVRTVEMIRNATDEERVQMRKVHSLSYKERYDMITKAIISDNEDLKKKAWDLLWGPGEKHKDVIWMRVQMMAEVWEHSKGERLEQLMLMSMERYLDYDLVRPMDDFEDADGQKYYQYMFLDPFGNDFNHIRRLPYAPKDCDRYKYERMLEECGIPTNYLHLQMEANEIRKRWDEHLEHECTQIQTVLERWKEHPEYGRKQLGIASRKEDEETPLNEEEVEYIQSLLQSYRERIKPV